MRFGYTIVYVADVAASTSFYERAFGFMRRFVHESGQYAELETGQTTLAFASNALADLNGVEIRPNVATQPAAGIELAFVTDEPEEALQQATQAGALLVKPVEEKPWGQRVGYVRDLNGCLIELCSPMNS